MRFLLASLLLISTGASAQTPLRLGVPVADSVGVHQEHVYTLDAAAGQFVAGDADGPDVDMMVRVVGPRGDTLETFDRGPRGPEPFQFVTATAGRYRIVALPYADEAGRYTLTLRRQEAAATETPADLEARLSQALAPFTGPDQPPTAVAVIRDGAIAGTASEGAASEGGDLRFDAGRIGEAITATAALRLATAGTLDLDADIQTYLPGLPAPTGPVTVRDLLEHRTGYHDVAAVYSLAGWTPADPLTQAAADTVLAHQPVLADVPRYRPSGGRTDAMVLARVLEAATFTSFGALMQAVVFEPFGMTETVVRTAPDQAVGRAAPRASTNARMGYVATAPSRDGTYGWGNVYTTIGDLARWTAALLDDRETLDRMAPPGVDFRISGAYGIMIDQSRGGGTELRMGDVVLGTEALIVVEPALRSGYVVLSAAGGVVEVGGVPTWKLAHEAFGERPQVGFGTVVGPPERHRPPPEPAGLDGFAPYHGRYVGATLGDTVEVRASRSGGLMAVGADGHEYPFYVPRGERTAEFIAEGSLGMVWFEYDAGGQPDAFVLQNEGVRGLRYARAGN